MFRSRRDAIRVVGLLEMELIQCDRERNEEMYESLYNSLFRICTECDIPQTFIDRELDIRYNK